MGSAKTTFEYVSGPWESVTADALIVPVFQGTPSSLTSSTKKTKSKGDDTPKPSMVWTDGLKALDTAMGGMISATVAEEKFTAATDSVLSFRKTPGDDIHARRIILVGLGKAEKTTLAHVESGFKKAVDSVLKLKDLGRVVLAVPSHEALKFEGDDEVVSILVDAVHQSTYVSLEAKEPSPPLAHCGLWLEGKPSTRLKMALTVAEVFARARSRSKDLVNMPSNLKTTMSLVDAAKVLGKKPGITCKVIDDLAWLEREMPAFFTVALGSVATDPPKFIQLHYKPKAGKPKHRVALVGKSVIFDTGGYQVKTGNFMNTMKGDMTGGSIVVAVMEALSELAPDHVEVFAYMAATPNKIDSHAMLPDAIVSSTCGKKIEIRHTDAEGRLTLIDAVAKAALEKPDVLVTVATLTGSASRAVGRTIALMANDEAVRDRFVQQARAVSDPIQTLDIFEEDYKDIKSKLDGADLINTSHSQHRGAQSAAAFVMSAAPEGLPMLHLDIAGADMTADEKATGIGAKSVLAFLLNPA